MKFPIPLLISVLVLTMVSAQAHQHFNAGILDENHNDRPDVGEALRFVDPPDPSAIFHFYPKAAGLEYGGYYSLDDDPRPLFPNDSFTFAALSDGQVDLASLDHAATGSWIWAQVISVTGPAGASVGFWDENWGLTHTTPTLEFLVGTPTGSLDQSSFVLSESSVDDPSRGPAITEDPQGHIHNRAWTVTQPGNYFVTFQLIDRSANGPGGSPIHDPSVPYTFHFLAVPEPGTLGLLGLSALAGIGWFYRPRNGR